MSRRIVLTRTETSDEGTFGVATINGEEICKTAEPPWRQSGERVLHPCG